MNIRSLTHQRLHSICTDLQSHKIVTVTMLAVCLDLFPNVNVGDHSTAVILGGVYCKWVAKDSIDVANI